MVVDVVQVNTSTAAALLRKVVQFVCGNALVCETIKDARSLAFDGQVRLKVSSALGHTGVSSVQFKYICLAPNHTKAVQSALQEMGK